MPGVCSKCRKFFNSPLLLVIAVSLLLGLGVLSVPKVGISDQPNVATQNDSQYQGQDTGVVRVSKTSASAQVDAPSADSNANLLISSEPVATTSPVAKSGVLQLAAKDKKAQANKGSDNKGSDNDKQDALGKRTVGLALGKEENRGADDFSRGKNFAARPKPEITSEQQAAVMNFLHAHHPELAEIIGSLEKRHPDAYARAVADLSRTEERLSQIRRHDEGRYERELAAWQTKSRIQLLVARIKMNPADAGLKAKFKELVTQQIEQQREQWKSERERLEQRLEKVDAQLEKLNVEPEQLIEQRMDQWLTSGEFALKKLGMKENAARQKNVTLKSKKSTRASVRTDSNQNSQP